MIDLFTFDGSEKALHPQFKNLSNSPRMVPARAVLLEIASTMDDIDGNFTEQFQTHGFDARTFELYLQALFLEAGHSINRSHARPDFLITKEGLTVAVEAVTANPTPGPEYQPYMPLYQNPPKDAQTAKEYMKQEAAIKFGSPLYSKLKKRYWDLPHVKGKPFVIAIETFHGDASLSLSSTALSEYLFGLDHKFHFENGKLVVEADTVKSHVGSKTIPSSFFTQPNTEFVSAILFSNAGTIPKFNRIGQQEKHRSKELRIVRYGTHLDHDPNATLPLPFAYEIGASGNLPEPWREGTVLIHNPHALHPLPPEWLGAGAEENLGENGTVITTWRDQFQPFASMTKLFPGDATDSQIQQSMREDMTSLAAELDFAEEWRK